MTRRPCRRGDLRAVPLFAQLNDTELAVLCTHGIVATMPPGSLCTEGEPATCLYVLLDGEAVTSKQSGGADVQIDRTSASGAHFGAWSACVDGDCRWELSVRLTRPSRLFVMNAATFAAFMRTHFALVVHLLGQQHADSNAQGRALGPRDMLLALGGITVGLTEQLSRSAAVMERAVAELPRHLSRRRTSVGLLGDAGAPSALAAWATVEAAVTDQVARAFAETRHTAGQVYTPPRSDAVDAQRRARISRWLRGHELAGDPDLLTTGGLDIERLEQVRALAGHLDLDPDRVFEWLHHTVDMELRLHEVGEASARIAALVAGAKQYSQMDRDVYRYVDVHELLRSTLVMFGDRIAMPGKGAPVTLVKHLDPHLPDIPCYAGDLNQVWTHLIANALEAMNGSGILTVRTVHEGTTVRVEINDNGVGIPPDLLDRVFSPFVTTKRPGEGAGLGLDLVRYLVVDKHHGTVEVASVPGDTTFVVRLPLRAYRETNE